ncbi:MAG: hypothetical protein K6U87_01815 [Firmicutes bacterium]|nr:hypothetical protein [Bacillota bacterium]
MSELEAAQAAMEACYEAGWSDGLPVLPPWPSRVEAFLATTSAPREAVVLSLDHLGRAVTVELAAVNAAMAGCKPEYFPVVLAALEALEAEGVARVGGWQSTTGGAPLLVVNGPVRQQLGFNASGNVLGPGFRANATVGRAIRLTILNALGIRPHDLDQSTQGTAAKWTLCVAENEEESPFEPLHAEWGCAASTSVVSALHIRSVDFVDNRQVSRPEQLLQDLAGTLVRTGAQVTAQGWAVILLGPEHAQLLAHHGYRKADVRQALWEKAAVSHQTLARAGKDGVEQPLQWRRPGRPQDGPPSDPLSVIRLVARPEHLAIVVTGAGTAGVSAVAHALGPSLNPGFQGWGWAAVSKWVR